MPLKDSPNERARTLTDLDRKFVVDVADMSPRASAYFRRRPFLLPEVCREWRVGYLPRDTGEDKSGGTMRGKIVYPYLSESGDVLTWFGRDPEFEEKHQKWEATDKSEREPEKFHFVKGFHRGLELFGQHLLRGRRQRRSSRDRPDSRRRAERRDPPVDLGRAGSGLCSNMITREQAEKVAKLAREVAAAS